MNAVDIAEARRMRLAGCSHSKIAARFGVSRSRIGQLIPGVAPVNGLTRPTVDELFDEKVVPSPDGCLEWTASLLSDGYGCFHVEGTTVRAHRYALEREGREIPAGMHVDHLCRNRKCVNTAHLEIVTPAENLRRGDVAKLRAVDAAQIRLEHAGFEGSDWAFARLMAPRFGVSPSAIRGIIYGETWKDVAA